jgi:hypothetical protein
MNELENKFYSIDNYTLIINSCNDYTNQKYNINLQSPQYANFKKILYQIMTHIYNKKKYFDLNELNGDVIKECKKYFKVNFSTNNELNNKNKNIQQNIRDLEINKGSVQTNIINERPIFNTPTSINKDFDKILNERNTENIVKLPTNINSSPIIEKAENPENFYENLKILQSKRENDIPYHVPSTALEQSSSIKQLKEDQKNLQSINREDGILLKNESQFNNIKGVYENESSNFSSISSGAVDGNINSTKIVQQNNDISNRFVLSHGDLMLERNNFLAETIRSNENSNPSDLYAANLNKFIQEKDYNDQLESKMQILSVRQNDIINTKTDKILEHYVSINSDDRDWYDKNDLRYKYKVKFNNVQSKEYIKVPVYENTEFIPETETRNTTGWYDSKNNISFPPYDIEKPKGKIVYYINKLLNNSKGLSVDSFYKNIDSIALTKVLLPVKDYIYNLHCNCDHIRPTILSLPFIYVEIDEFEGIYQGTNTNIKKTFCKLIYDGCYNCDDGRGYIEFSPINDDVKKFSPNPLSSLNSLTISIMKPDGTLLNDKKDITNIKTIILEGCKLKIITEIYFHKYDINIMDKIRIKNFKLIEYDVGDTASINTDIESLTTLSESSCHISQSCESSCDVMTSSDITLNELEEYINNENGHFIGKIGEVNEFGYCNSFYIDAPGEINLEYGIFKIKKNIDSLLIYQDNSKTYFINLSMQNYLEFTISTLEGDVSIFNSIPNLNN